MALAAGLRVLQGAASCRDVLGARPAAAADDLCPFGAPAQRHLRVLASADLLLGLPAGAGVVAEVGVHAQRQVGEVTQVRHHPVDVVGRDAVDQQGADTDLLEPACGTPEGVAFGAAPVLPVYAAQSMGTAAERDPQWDLGVSQRSHHLEQ